MTSKVSTPTSAFTSSKGTPGSIARAGSLPGSDGHQRREADTSTTPIRAAPRPEPAQLSRSDRSATQPGAGPRFR